MAYCMDVINSGTVPIDYITVAYLEDSVISDPEETFELPEDVYERDVFSHSLRVFWLESVGADGQVHSAEEGSFLSGFAKVGSSKGERFRIRLLPGQQATIKMGIFGKKNCVGGSLILEYGYIEPSLQIESEKAFHTRELRVPFILTVRSALTAKNMDFLALKMEDTELETKDGLEKQGRAFSAEDLILDPYSDSSQPRERFEVTAKSKECYFTFDMQNTWSSSIEVVWEVYEGKKFQISFVFIANVLIDGTVDPVKTYKSFIHGGMNKRYIFIVPKN